MYASLTENDSWGEDRRETLAVFLHATMAGLLLLTWDVLCPGCRIGKREVTALKDLKAQPSPTVGEVFVFVDECHRTQGGKLNQLMKAMMPNAVFIGFTGTPLLKKDKQTSLEVFGGYIHTYKFSEGVEDEVVLDLVYEARDIDQRLGSQGRIDAWFEAYKPVLGPPL